MDTLRKFLEGMTFSSDKEVKRHAMGFLSALDKYDKMKPDHLYITNEAPKAPEEEGRAFKTAEGCYKGIASQLELIEKAKTDKKRDALLEEMDGFSYGLDVERIFHITLAGGGPACRITGELDENNEPYNVIIEYQDWGTPWTEYRPASGEILEKFAQRFYFGD